MEKTSNQTTLQKNIFFPIRFNSLWFQYYETYFVNGLKFFQLRGKKKASSGAVSCSQRGLTVKESHLPSTPSIFGSKRYIIVSKARQMSQKLECFKSSRAASTVQQHRHCTSVHSYSLKMPCPCKHFIIL